jgi:hypothetical protein
VGTGYLVRLGKSQVARRKPKDLLVSKSELVLMAAQDEVESGSRGMLEYRGNIFLCEG